MELYNHYILIITILLILVFYRWYVGLNGKIRIFSITSFFFICYLIYALVGSALLNCTRFEAEDYNGVYSHPEILMQVWLYTVLGLFSLFVGFTISHEVFRKHFNILGMHRDADKKGISIYNYDISNKNFRWIAILFLFSVSVLLLYRHQIGGFPLEQIFSGLKGAELGLLRSDATNGFEGHLYRYRMFMEVLPLFLFILISFIKDYVDLPKWKLLYFSLLVYNIIYALITLQKAPIIFLMIICYIIYTYKKGRIEKKPLIIVGAVSVVLIIFMYIFFMGVSEETPASDILNGALHRIFISSIMPFFWIIKYTNEHGFLLGRTFPNPAGILPFEHFNLTVEIMDYAKGFKDEGVGSMPTVFIGEMYADFWIIGIVISAVFVGFFLQTIDIYFWSKMRKEKTALLSAIFIWLIYKMHHYTFTGFSGIIIDTDYYIIGLLVYWFIRKRIKYNKRYPNKLVRF